MQQEWLFKSLRKKCLALPPCSLGMFALVAKLGESPNYTLERLCSGVLVNSPSWDPDYELAVGGEFPDGWVVRILGFHCNNPGSFPGRGTEIPPAVHHGPPRPPTKEKIKKHAYMCVFHAIWGIPWQSSCIRKRPLGDSSPLTTGHSLCLSLQKPQTWRTWDKQSSLGSFWTLDPQNPQPS